MQSLYCVHSSTLFPTWHRPYVALYEQRIHEIMTGIAGSYSSPDDVAKYTAAAAQWRLPYWEYTAPKQRNGSSSLRIPLMLEDQYKTITVYNTPGLIGTIDNPMWKYNFDLSPNLPRQYKVNYGQVSVKRFFP